jgi:hypothetical protein
MHLSAVDYTPDKRHEYNEWLSTIPYILPCKFCRASLISYYEELPPDYTSAKTMSKWLWKIHGKVNNKLRGQGQQIPADPPFVAVYNKYSHVDPHECPDIWPFLFSTAFQHPRSTKSLPMPDTPEGVRTCDLSEPDKCRWNLMCASEKMPYFRRFWKALPNVLPDLVAIKWLQALMKNPMRVENKYQTLKWLYRQYEAVCGNKVRRDMVRRDMVRPFPAIIEELEAHSSDCNKSKRARTCRRRPGSSISRRAISRRAISRRAISRRATRKTLKNH